MGGKLTLTMIEVLALAVAALSMAFSGYQTLLLRKSLDDPFQANLQIKQIDACEEVAIYFDQYSRIIFRRELRGSRDTPLGQKWLEDLEAAEMSLNASLTKLSIYSGEQTQVLISDIRGSLTKEFGTILGYPGASFVDLLREGTTKITVSDASAQDHFSEIMHDCRKAMRQGPEGALK